MTQYSICAIVPRGTPTGSVQGADYHTSEHTMIQEPFVQPNPRRSRTASAVMSAWVLLLLPAAVHAQAGAAVAPAGWETFVPTVSSLVAFDREQSDLRSAVVRYDEDRAAVDRRYAVAYSTENHERLRQLLDGWRASLEATDFDALNREGQVDYVLLRNRIEFELAMLDEREGATASMAPLVPFAQAIGMLQETRHVGERPDARAAAQTLTDIADQVEELTDRVRAGDARGGGIGAVMALRAARWIESLAGTLEDWYEFAAGYDPLFTWWVEEPYGRVSEMLETYAATVEEELGGGGSDVVVGLPIGEEGLAAHLRHEMIPYSAAELIAIAEQEFAWMEDALADAAREMGYDDWRAAQEAVKEMAVEPGEKPALIYDLEGQSVSFVEENFGITLPPLAREIFRARMMSPERQLVAPFFLGGETIQISYPTNTMSHEQKLMSMRGNNPHFNRATVHHELIPGHHLQGFMTDRFNPHRAMFSTPFWGEGWALYWEILLWERDFPRGPEDRIGMLFWRMHRAARIIFSLSYHRGEMTPEEAVDFLVERVGHERANAEAEVRRSFEGNYSPLYQVAYMIGGMQFRALYDELVETGRMTEQEYHDAVLQGGRMPVGMVRARLLETEELGPDYRPSWRWAGDPMR
jgi:uncharacterized protein (DUF885 family)